MENLNERCLYHINTHLEPHDWIQVSRVSQLWKRATLLNWKTLITFEHMSNDTKIDKLAIDISVVDATEIVLSAAPFINLLNLESPTNQKHQYIKFESDQKKYYYKVENFKIEKILKLLIKKSTEIDRIRFVNPPSATLVKPLFKKNKITKLNLKGFKFGWYSKIPTHGIEELILKFGPTVEDVVSFEGCFQNLKKLNLEIVSRPNQLRHAMLSKMLVHVPGLKSLDLTMINGKDSCTLLSDVFKLSNLEKLSLKLAGPGYESPESFLKQLQKCCLKLRVLKFWGLMKDEVEFIQTVFTFPRLESIDCILQKGFPLIELPKMQHLTELSLAVTSPDPIFTGFFKAVQNITTLERLRVEFVTNVKESGLLLLVCGVISAATSLGKEVVLTHLDEEKSPRELRVTKFCTEEIAILFEDYVDLLQLSVNYKNEKTLFKGVTEFVQKKLRGYHIFVL